jgi:hypothetical protein
MIKSKWDENIEKQKQEQDRRENDDHRSYFSIDDLDGLKKEPVSSCLIQSVLSLIY